MRSFNENPRRGTKDLQTRYKEMLVIHRAVILLVHKREMKTATKCLHKYTFCVIFIMITTKKGGGGGSTTV